jgi:hypothetical protein
VSSADVENEDDVLSLDEDDDLLQSELPPCDCVFDNCHCLDIDSPSVPPTLTPEPAEEPMPILPAEELPIPILPAQELPMPILMPILSAEELPMPILPAEELPLPILPVLSADEVHNILETWMYVPSHQSVAGALVL